MAEYCQDCGQHLEGSEYCPRCGAAQETGGQAVQQQQQRGQQQQQPHPQQGRQPQQSPARQSQDDGGWSFIKTAVVAVVLIVVVLAAISFTLGFLGSGESQHELYSDLHTDRNGGTSSVALTISGTLPEGRYAAYRLGPDISVNYEIAAEASQPIDVYVMDKSEFDQRYRDASDDIQFYNGLSETETTSWSGGGELSSGDYMLVIDNTGVYGASPDGSAEVDIITSGSV